MSRRTMMMVVAGLLVTVLAHLAIAGIFSSSADAKRGSAVETAVDPNAACGSESEPIEDPSALNTDSGDNLSNEERNDPLRAHA
jgi:hypothetical protein